MGEFDPSSTTVAALVARAAAEFGDREGLVDAESGHRFTFAELAEEVDRFAGALIASGIQSGEAVAVWVPNSWEWVVAALGTLRAGAVLVPVNTRFKGREAAYVLGKARVRALVTARSFMGTDYVAELAAHSADLEDLTEVVAMRASSAPDATGWDDFVARATPDTIAEVADRTAAYAPDDTALIMFTSGTTGLPKGVMVAQGPMVRAFIPYADALGLGPGDRMMVMNPMFHAFGFNGAIVPCLRCGATIVAHAVFDVPVLLQTVQAERITAWPGPPAVFQGLLNYDGLGDYDIATLRSCVTGAASIPVEMVQGMRERLGFETVVTAYGMTETTGLATVCRPGDDDVTVATTSGRPVGGTEVKIVDDEFNELPPGEAGEIVVRGFQVMKGYLDDPDQTAEAITPDGWLHTGDIGVQDERGYIDITDRKKDMYIIGGFNAYPAEIERTMIEHPQIGQAAVVGVPDERLGEVGAAFVVPAPGRPPSPAELIAWCREQMANYKVPRNLWVVDELPLNPSNKVLKFELRERAQALLEARD
ncbi:MAG: AMP-binding protein [Actinomycetia bacterium]|nr:AMP-binding protein [Actinomycetes bacterium]